MDSWKEDWQKENKFLKLNRKKSNKKYEISLFKHFPTMSQKCYEKESQETIFNHFKILIDSN